MINVIFLGKKTLLEKTNAKFPIQLKGHWHNKEIMLYWCVRLRFFQEQDALNYILRMTNRRSFKIFSQSSGRMCMIISWLCWIILSRPLFPQQLLDLPVRLLGGLLLQAVIIASYTTLAYHVLDADTAPCALQSCID